MLLVLQFVVSSPLLCVPLPVLLLLLLLLLLLQLLPLLERASEHHVCCGT